MTEEEAIERLLDCKSVAVVGLSSNPLRDSNEIATYLQQVGYRVVPVNPAESEVLGEKAYAGLRNIPFKVDAVNVFRRAEFLSGIVDDAIAIGAVGVWGQFEVVDEAAAARARAAGLAMVMDRCWYVEHRRRRGGQLY
ncbi:MAG: CoA-binding protein [Candidatus Dormibacteria bacterium]